MVNNLSVPPTGVKAFNACPNNSLLKAFPDQALTRLLPFLESVELSADQYLYRPGMRIDHLYFPETTAISEFRLLEDGRRIDTVLTGSEGMIGLIGFLSRSPAGNWTQPLVGGTTLKIEIGRFRQEFEGSCELQRILFAYLSRYIGQISQNIICNMYHSVEQRFCGWVGMVSKKLNTDQLPLTQERIAESLGLHRPTVSKIAGNLRRSQTIEYLRGDIQILDFGRLEALQGDCYRTPLLSERAANRSL